MAILQLFSQNNLKRLQATFVNFLAETNGKISRNYFLQSVCLLTPSEITQEVASRGLGLTYDLCDGSVKQEMVQSLVGTLMEGRRYVFSLSLPPPFLPYSRWQKICSVAFTLFAHLWPAIEKLQARKWVTCIVQMRSTRWTKRHRTLVAASMPSLCTKTCVCGACVHSCVTQYTQRQRP